MNENTNNNDVLEEAQEAVAQEAAETAEETVEAADEAVESAEEKVEETVETAEETAETAQEVTDTAEDTVEAAADTAEDTIEATAEGLTDAAGEIEPAQEIASEEAAEPAKKKFPLQVPVIIALCLVAAALIGYFVYSAFFLREPEGVTWAAEIEGITYYLDFNTDNTFKAHIGSIEVDGTYHKSKNQPKQDLTGATVDETQKVDTISLDFQIAYFVPGYAAEYEITGSRILGNQVFHGTYGQGLEFTMQQAKWQKPEIEKPADLQIDEDLVGTWVFNYSGEDIYKLTFDKDGNMSFTKFQEGTTYNGTYTISNGQINFTYVVADSTVVPLDYSLSGDILSCLNVNFVREGSGATPDQPFAVPAETPTE